VSSGPPAQQEWSAFVLTPIISIQSCVQLRHMNRPWRLNVTSQARSSAETLISHVYCKFVINQYPIGPYIKPKGFHHQYLLNDAFFVSIKVSIKHRFFAHTSGKKHCESISFLILKCLFVSFEVDKIKVEFKWFLTFDVWISWRSHDFCNLHLWMTYNNSAWWLRYRTLRCPVFQKRFNTVFNLTFLATGQQYV